MVPEFWTNSKREKLLLRAIGSPKIISDRLCYREKINCVRRRKNALLIAFGVEILWNNQRMNERILGRVSGIHRRFCKGG